MTATTPPNVTAEIADFCQSIDATTTPQFVDVIPTPFGIPHECFHTTRDHAMKHGGGIQYGWLIWETPGSLLDAEFHAVWMAPTGELIDVAPKPDGETQILFLPDSKRVWEERLVPNHRKILRDSTELRERLRRADEIVAIKQRHYHEGEFDVAAADAELRQAAANWKRLPARRALRVGRNEPCPCGSGKKFKKCCGNR